MFVRLSWLCICFTLSLAENLTVLGKNKACIVVVTGFEGGGCNALTTYGKGLWKK